MANVRVDVEAADKASATINKVAGAVGGLSNTAAASASGFGKLVGNVDGMVRSLTGFSLAQVSVAGAVAKGAEMVTEAISNYSAYVEQVDHMAIRTGMATEEISRLVQVADDFRVETATLERAMTLALQNGFEPTTENLAKLADQFVSIQDPTERAAAMQDIFGKSWADLVPLLEKGGDAIRNASAGIAENMIVTEEAVKQNRAYQLALGDMQDAWTGVQNEAANGLIPYATVFADDLRMLLEGKSLFEMLAYNQEEYRKIEERAVQTKRMQSLELGKQANAMYYAATASEYIARQQQVLATSINAATAATSRSIAPTAQAGEQYRIAALAAQQSADALERYRGMQEQLPVLTQNVADAQMNLNVTMQQFSEDYAGKVQSALQAAGVEGEKYAEALGIADKQNGTNLLGQYRANEALEAAAKGFEAGTLTAEEFGAVLAANKTEWEQLDENVQQAKSALEQAKGAFDALMADMASWNGKTFTIQVTTGGTGGRDPGGTGGVTEQVCCFAGYTPIATPDGDRAIDSLNDGDMVLVWTGAGTEAAPVVRRYMAVRTDTILVGLVDGRILHTTPNHPLMLEDGEYRPAGELAAGERLAGAQPGIVLAVALLSGSFPVYDISVGHDAHNFLADGICAHNKPVPDFRSCGSINPSSGRVGGGGNVTIDIRNITVVTGNAQEFVNQLGKLAARGRSSGAGYAGG